MLCIRNALFAAVGLSLLLAPGLSAQSVSDPIKPPPYAMFNVYAYGAAQGLDLSVAMSGGGVAYAALGINGPAGSPFVLALGASQQNLPLQGINVLVGGIAIAIPGILPPQGVLLPLSLPQILDPGIVINGYAQAIGLDQGALIASQGYHLELRGVASVR